MQGGGDLGGWEGAGGTRGGGGGVVGAILLYSR